MGSGVFARASDLVAKTTPLSSLARRSVTAASMGGGGIRGDLRIFCADLLRTFVRFISNVRYTYVDPRS